MPNLSEYKIYTVQNGEIKKKVGLGQFRYDRVLSKQIKRLLISKRKKVQKPKQFYNI